MIILLINTYWGIKMFNNTPNKSCFIITPIGNSNSAIRRKIDGLIEEVIEPVLKELKYDVIVSHRISESGSMTNAIIKGVYESDLVIANLTGNNPNVMYEVALRHASAKPIIHITENINDLPFDINDQRTIEYTDDMAGAHKLKDDLRNMISNIDFSKLVDNPVTIALEKRNLVNIPEGTTAKDFSDVLYQIKDDINMLKRDVTSLRNKSYHESMEDIILRNYMENEDVYDYTTSLLKKNIEEQARKARVAARKKGTAEYIEKKELDA